MISIISFTNNGEILNKKISELLRLRGERVRSAHKTDNLGEWTKTAFENSKAIIFIGAVGMAVRAAAPYVKSKATDPALICCDELGRFAIPVLSGHIGGANELSQIIAEGIGALSVITTATDINGVWAVDVWAVKKGYAIENIENIKYISSALLRGEKIGLKGDGEFICDIPKDIITTEPCDRGIVVSPVLDKPFKHTLNIVPKCIYIGVGSKKNADENALTELFKEQRISKNAVLEVATIDIKKEERSVLRLCEYIGCSLSTYGADELQRVEGEFTSSDFVKETVGVDNVCERSAMVKGNKLLVKKLCGKGVTMAIAQKRG